MANFNFDDTIPAANNNPSADQPIMLANNVASTGIIAVDHLGFNTDDGGQHKQVTFNDDPLRGYPFIPAIPTAPPVLFTNTVNTIPQLFFYSGTSSQGSSQYSVTAANGSTFLFGGMILKWFTDTIGSLTKRFNFDNSVIVGSTALNIGTFPNNIFGAVVSLSGTNTSNIVTATLVSTNLIDIRSSFGGITTGTFHCFVIGN